MIRRALSLMKVASWMMWQRETSSLNNRSQLPSASRPKGRVSTKGWMRLMTLAAELAVGPPTARRSEPLHKLRKRERVTLLLDAVTDG